MGSKIIGATWFVFGLVLSSHAVAQNVDHSSAIDKAPINDWKSSPAMPGSSAPIAGRSNLHLSLTPVSTQAFQRMPFYAMAPYWLPRSRPFKTNHAAYTVQPATHGALINDVAALIRSASSN
ncbi:hypothetical protein [Dyella sp.]|uniref:hypothetical protein n=1 Tax=Dyella sp. TaxID=1869338 RepID=UPI002B46C8E9|nr:hypothetical protein [Dyella sp.]HKT26728.1 hypothetical protein [Dyella sp.]